jgi:hypothetical protein
MKHSYLIFFAFCCFNLKTQAQAKWNCGVEGATNVVAIFNGTTQTLTISGTGKMNDYSCRAGNAPWNDLKDAIKIVKINQGVTRIGDHAFCSLKNLETVTIANSVTFIGDGAFAEATSLHKINIPNGVTHIGNSAFRSTGLESISLPLSLKGDGMGAAVFAGCDSLKTVDLGKTQLLSLEMNVFANCEQLEDVYFPSKMNYIGEGVFSGCKSLKSITCYNSTPPRLSIFTFSSINKDDHIDLSQVTLYVPEASIIVYKNSDAWKKEFDKIEAIPRKNN